MPTHSDQVDMLAQAREAQWEAGAFGGANAVKLVAPAKVNLFLAVGAKRADGLHEVTNVMQALALHDVLYVRHEPLDEASFAQTLEAAAAEGEGASVAMAGPEASIAVDLQMVDKTGDAATALACDVPTRENLVFKAIDLLARLVGRSVPERFAIRVEKQVPAQAGLGGGSADAAAALKAAAHFWGAEDQLVAEAARQTGSDVAFFLEGGCALFEGAGEKLARKLAPSKAPLVVVKPPAGVSTSQAYAAFDAAPVPVPAELLASAQQAECADAVPLFNNLQTAAERLCPAVADVREWLESLEGIGPDNVLMSGSGAAVFALAPDFGAASAIAGQAQAQGWWARATTASSLMAARLP